MRWTRLRSFQYGVLCSLHLCTFSKNVLFSSLMLVYRQLLCLLELKVIWTTFLNFSVFFFSNYKGLLWWCKHHCFEAPEISQRHCIISNFPCLFADNPISDCAIRHFAPVTYLQKQTQWVHDCFMTQLGFSVVHVKNCKCWRGLAGDCSITTTYFAFVFCDAEYLWCWIWVEPVCRVRRDCTENVCVVMR